MPTRVSGFVVDTGGVPVASVSVTPRASDGTTATPVTTDTAGYWAAAGLPDKTWTGTVTSSSHRVQHSIETLLTDDVHNQSNTLSAHDFSQLRGKVVQQQINSGSAASGTALVADGGGNAAFSALPFAPLAFSTVTTPTGGPVVAEVASDTLALAVGSTKMTIAGTAGSDTITFDVVEANLTLSNIGGAVTDSQVPNTITLDNITQITTRSHTSLTDIGTNTHPQIDTHIAAANPHSGSQPLDATLTALAAFNTNGLLTQTAADTFTGRTITGTADRITVSNGDGVAGNPTLTISATYPGQTSITTLGTIGTGVWNADTITVAKGGTSSTTVIDAFATLGAQVIAFAGDISPTIAADQNNWAPTGVSNASAIRVDGGAASRNITGLDNSQAPGRVIWLFNIGANNIVLVDESASSDEDNRFALMSNLTITPDTSAMLWYDFLSSRWRAVGAVGSSSMNNLLDGMVHSDTIAQAASLNAVVVGTGANLWSKVTGPATWGFLCGDNGTGSPIAFTNTLPNDQTIIFGSGDAKIYGDSGGDLHLSVPATGFNRMLYNDIEFFSFGTDTATGTKPAMILRDAAGAEYGHIALANTADMLFRVAGASNKFFWQTASTTQMTLEDNKITWEAGASDVGINFGTSGRMGFEIAGTVEVQIRADEMVLLTGGTTVGFGWTTSGILDFHVGGTPAMSLAATTLTFENGVNDFQFNFGTDGELIIKRATTEMFRFQDKVLKLNNDTTATFIRYNTTSIISLWNSDSTTAANEAFKFDCANKVLTFAPSLANSLVINGGTTNEGKFLMESTEIMRITNTDVQIFENLELSKELRLAPIAAPGSAAGGELWYDSDRATFGRYFTSDLYYDIVCTQVQKSGSAVNSVVGSTTEDTLLPSTGAVFSSNSRVAHKVMRVTAWGIRRNDGPSGFTVLRLFFRMQKAGPTNYTLLNTGDLTIPATSGSDLPWRFQGNIVCNSTGGTPNAWAHGEFTYWTATGSSATAVHVPMFSAVITVDWSASLTCDLRVAVGPHVTTSGSVRLDTFLLEDIN